MSNDITFNDFRKISVARCLRWHPEGIESWSPSDWLVAVTGELGELASLLKMRNRERDGLPGNKFSPTDKMVADELADVFTYLDLLACALGVNLGEAAVAKFNEVSERVGFPERIEPPLARTEQVVVIGASRVFGYEDDNPDSGEWYREITVGGVMFLAPLDKQDAARHILASIEGAGIGEVMDRLRGALHSDPEYAWSWHCNLAMASVDEGLSHAAANRAAARFMYSCFGLDTTKNAHYATDAPALARSVAEIEAVRYDLLHDADRIPHYNAEFASPGDARNWAAKLTEYARRLAPIAPDARSVEAVAWRFDYCGQPMLQFDKPTTAMPTVFTNVRPLIYGDTK